MPKAEGMEVLEALPLGGSLVYCWVKSTSALHEQIGGACFQPSPLPLFRYFAHG